MAAEGPRALDQRPLGGRPDRFLDLASSFLGLLEKALEMGAGLLADSLSSIDTRTAVHREATPTAGRACGDGAARGRGISE